MDPPRARPPIFKIALSFLAQLVYRSWMLSKRKTVEIRLWEFEWKPPYRRVRGRYSHVVFRMVKPLRQGEGRTNIMATCSTCMKLAAPHVVSCRVVSCPGVAWRGVA